jgi:hypothetical protein
MRHQPVGGALLPLSTSGCRNPRLFEDGYGGMSISSIRIISNSISIININNNNSYGYYYMTTGVRLNCPENRSQQ